MPCNRLLIPRVTLARTIGHIGGFEAVCSGEFRIRLTLEVDHIVQRLTRIAVNEQT
jgi:hypothetical protein